MTVQPTNMSVQVRKGSLRAAPSFLGKVTGPVDYGDRVTVLEEKGSWRRVAAPNGGRGWIHQSAVTVKRIVLQTGDADVQTSARADEVALAGKGFSEQVETAYRRSNPQLKYAWLDRMEGYTVSAEEMATFVMDGGLVPKGGEQ